MILDKSSIDLNSKQFGTATAADVPFIVYRHPQDDDIYMYYDDCFMIDETNLCEVTKEGLTFEEASNEVMEMRKKYFEEEIGSLEANDDASEGDVYHTISVNPDGTGTPDIPEEDIPEVDADYVPRYDGTLLLNKDNYTISTEHLSPADCDKLQIFRGKLLDMASDFYGGAVEPEVVIKDLQDVFDQNNIKVDMSEWNVDEDINKKTSIMLLNTLSYVDTLIIAIQYKALEEK